MELQGKGNRNREITRIVGLPFQGYFADERFMLSWIAHRLGLKPGDEVIVSPWSSGSVSLWAARHCLVPVPAEILPSLTLDPVDVRRKITNRTRAIFLDHPFGLIADVREFGIIARDYRLHLIEDISHAVGGFFQDRPVGADAEVAWGRFGGAGFLSNPFGLLFSSNDLFSNFEIPARSPATFWLVSGLLENAAEVPGPVAGFLIPELMKFRRSIELKRKRKNQLKKMLKGIPGLEFPEGQDSSGEAVSGLHVTFADREIAGAVTRACGPQRIPLVPLAGGQGTAHWEIRPEINRRLSQWSWGGDIPNHVRDYLQRPYTAGIEGSQDLLLRTRSLLISENLKPIELERQAERLAKVLRQISR